MISVGPFIAARSRRVCASMVVVAAFACGLVGVPAASAAPPNDNFANAITVQAVDDAAQSDVVQATNVQATKEANEPNHPDPLNSPNSGGASVWYSWTPTYTAPAQVVSCSHYVGTPFESLLGVYTGTSLGSLTPAGSNQSIDCTGSGFSDPLNTFTAQAGTTYRIAIDGAAAAQGDFLFGVFQQAQNDDFANAETLTGMTDSTTGNNVSSSTESGEPTTHGPFSIWYRWKAPVTGKTTITTCGSDFNTQLAAYQGTAVNALTLVASNEDAANCGPQSKIAFNATKDVTYRIAVGGHDCCGAPGDYFTGAVSLHLTETQVPQTTITSGPSGLTRDTTPTFKFTSSATGSTFQCRFDGQAFKACSGPGATHTPASALSQGAHTFYVRALKNGTPDPTPASRKFTVDSVPPQTTITSGPSGTTHDSTPTFAFASSEAGSTFKCMIRTASGTGSFGPCSGPGATHTPSLPLGNGKYVFSVRATDKAGNTDPTPANRAFTVSK